MPDNPADDAAIRRALADAVETVKGKHVALTPELDPTSLVVFEIDSLDLLEIGMLVEEALDIELRIVDVDELPTVGDVVRLIRERSSRAD